jgi:hypothetical protein
MSICKAQFSGIIKAVGDDLVVAATEAWPLVGGRSLKPKHWHVTLVHQSLVKAHRKALKKIELPDLPAIDFLPVSAESHRDWVCPETDALRESWVLWVAPETQVALEEWVNDFLNQLGVEEREDRRFHLSVSNLTGNPSDSVR